MTRGHGNLKVAKTYNNVIGEILFDIPLENVQKQPPATYTIFTQVCIPGLHSLGIFNRLWTLLEEACTDLDFKLVQVGGAGDCGGSSFISYYDGPL